jgi:NTE family protein
VFPPVLIGGRLLVDGGVANNTPISTALRLGAKRIIVLPTGFACALKQVPSGAIARAMHALSLLVARQLVRDAEQYAGTVELRIVPTLCPLDLSPYDYSACGALIDRAAANTRKWLESGGLERAGTPGELHEHTH